MDEVHDANLYHIPSPSASPAASCGLPSSRATHLKAAATSAWADGDMTTYMQHRPRIGKCADRVQPAAGRRGDAGMTPADTSGSIVGACGGRPPSDEPMTRGGVLQLQPHPLAERGGGEDERLRRVVTHVPRHEHSPM